MTSIPYNNLVLTNDNSFTYSLWMYVNNWYSNVQNWKHVFHVGSDVTPACSGSLAWNQINYQCPGVWLKPTINDMRVVIQTMTVIPPQCASQFYRENDILESFQNDSGGGGSSCSLSHAADTSAMNINLPAYMSANPETTTACTGGGGDGVGTTIAQNLALLEYVDVSNIPIGEWFQVTVNVNQKEVEVYLDGKLYVTKVLVGSPVINAGNAYFGLGSTYSGFISSFHYSPTSLPYGTIWALYNREKRLKGMSVVM
jgi:phosphoribosylformylglycinamidine (FGAM) synthase PurS component